MKMIQLVDDYIKKQVWVHTLMEQVYDKQGNLLYVNVVKGYTSKPRLSKPQQQKKKIEIQFDDEVEER